MIKIIFVLKDSSKKIFEVPSNIKCCYSENNNRVISINLMRDILNDKVSDPSFISTLYHYVMDNQANIDQMIYSISSIESPISFIPSTIVVSYKLGNQNKFTSTASGSIAEGESLSIDRFIIAVDKEV